MPNVAVTVITEPAGAFGGRFTVVVTSAYSAPLNSVSVLLAGLPSPPPDTVTVLVTLAGAVGATSTVRVIGGIAAPLAVTHMMVLENGFSHVFSMFTAVLLAVAAVILVLGEETKGKTLESIGL